jgi:hypothetical protein
MGYPMSKELSRIWLEARLHTGTEVDLQLLCRRVALEFEPDDEVARALLSANGSIRAVDIGVYLVDLVNYDAVVRDIMTTGHLAKLLCRLSVLKKTANIEIIGLRNKLFDQKSLKERADYFREGGGFDFSLRIVNSKEATEMLASEAGIIDRLKGSSR